MRELVRVVNIDEIKPIEGADAIECAVVGGWEVVVKKGKFMPGDSAFYFEIDSWIPHALAPFLTKGKPKVYNGVEGNKLKTVRMRGQLSQGLLIKNSDVLAYLKAAGVGGGTDSLADVLNVQLWEAAEEGVSGSTSGMSSGSDFPNYVPKTDQTRVQNLGRKLQQYKEEGNVFEVTEKVEGQSMTVIYHNGEFIVCSRNKVVEESDNNLWKAVNKYNLKENLTKLCEETGRSLAIQGELVGPGIQKNIYGLKEVDFYVFDIYDITEAEYCDCFKVNYFVDTLGLKHVPLFANYVIGRDMSIQDLLALADGYTAIGNNPTQRREGLVFKKVFNTGDSFKCVSNKYLLGEK